MVYLGVFGSSLTPSRTSAAILMRMCGQQNGFMTLRSSARARRRGFGELERPLADSAKGVDDAGEEAIVAARRM